MKNFLKLFISISILSFTIFLFTSCPSTSDEFVKPTEEMSSDDVTSWKDNLIDLIWNDNKYSELNSETTERLPKDITKEITIDGNKENVIYYKSNTSFVNKYKLTSADDSVNSKQVYYIEDFKIFGKYTSANKNFSFEMYSATNDGNMVVDSYAKLIDGDETYNLDVTKLVDIMKWHSSDDDSIEYKKLDTIISGIKYEFHNEELNKIKFDNYSFDNVSNILGEQYNYNTFDGDGKTGDNKFKLKSNGDIKLTINGTSLTIRYDITEIRTLDESGLIIKDVVSSDSYLYVKKSDEDFKIFPLTELGYDIE